MSWRNSKAIHFAKKERKKERSREAGMPKEGGEKGRREGEMHAGKQEGGKARKNLNPLPVFYFLSSLD